MHSTEIRVRAYECDIYGHVNNSVYLNYLEFARERFLEDLNLSYQNLLDQGYGIWVAEAHLSYLSPALPGEKLVVTTKPSALGGATAELQQSIQGPNGRAILDARMKLVWVNSDRRPTRIPADWKQRFAKEV